MIELPVDARELLGDLFVITEREPLGKRGPAVPRPTAWFLGLSNVWILRFGGFGHELQDTPGPTGGNRAAEATRPAGVG